MSFRTYAEKYIYINSLLNSPLPGFQMIHKFIITRILIKQRNSYRQLVEELEEISTELSIISSFEASGVEINEVLKTDLLNRSAVNVRNRKNLLKEIFHIESCCVRENGEDALTFQSRQDEFINLLNLTLLNSNSLELY